jgi:L-threonylcarbamoyladenylate synthase
MGRDLRPDDLARAIDWLRRGGIVAFPTDTLYGLTVDPTSESAVASLFDLKGRRADAALPFVAASADQVFAWTPQASRQTRQLASAFWPGPLSLIVDAPGGLASSVQAADGSVAVRVPAHEVARALAAAWGSPIPATSANRSGEAPAIAASDLGALSRDARVLVVDAGPAPGGLPSTIVDARRVPTVLVRAGVVPWSRVLESVQE